MSRIITRLLPLLLFVVFHLCYPGNAGAQQPDRSPSLNLGDAVVTGFSGTLAPDAAKPLPANKTAIDLTFINPDGPSARVIDIRQPGYVWDGRLLAAPKIFDVLAKDVGQVFGIALDDQTPPNIYVAATSMYGLNIVGRGGDGSPERRKKGGPGVGWMKGQFGLDLQGGPGAIYKVDGSTGAVTLLANVTLDGVPNPGTGLGNLAYDSAHKQLFVSDLYTGMIHRFDLNGNELGHYDHGVTGLGAAKLAAVPFDPKNRPNIASARFDSEKPDSWGFAPAARRVWGLAVQDGRLYYSVVGGPQIWSVGIASDGSFGADPRWELDVPAQAAALPVSDIAFSHQGAMILAQRGLIAGAFDYSAFTQPGEPQVLRFWLKGPNDPPSPGRWKLVPEEYAVGFAGDDRNTNGGVALGYGYGQDGTLSATVCDAALWTTGQNLRNNPALRSQLEPGGPLVVHGLQGSPADLVRNANTPPTTSYFVDYDDKFDDPAASGHIGSVRVYTTPCAPAAYAQPVAVAATPAGGGGGGGGGGQGPACFAPSSLTLPPCTQPGQSVSLDLSTPTNWTVAPGGPPTPIVFGPWTALPGHWIEPNQTGTVSTYTYTRTFNLPCSPDSYRKGSLQLSGHVAADNSVTSVVLNTSASLAFCPGLTCFTNPAAGTPFTDANPADFKQGANTLTVIVGNVQGSPTGMSLTGSVTATCGSECVCGCPPGKVLRGKECVPPTCPPPQIPNADGVCVCPPPMQPGPVPGTCVCPRGTTLVDGKCVSPCPSPQILNADGVCVCPPPLVTNPATGKCSCPEGTVLEGKECVTIRKQCLPPQVMNPATGQCGCPEGTVLEGKECVSRNVRPIVCKPPLIPNAAGKACVCSPGTVQRGRACVPIEHNGPPEFGPGRGQFPGRGGEGGNPFGGHGGGPGGGGGGPGGGGEGPRGGSGGAGTFGR